ncbi:MAG: two-component sensor histidine kinase [Desulfamplus sp.]|nr:two-component sensor histidine kinase [Desulfamplus sp.]
MVNPVEMQRGLKWLISLRIIFAIVLIFSTLLFSTNESMPIDALPFIAIYLLALLMLLLSVSYGFLFKKFSFSPLFAYLQLTIDSITVSAIIFITGGFQSIFTFIYLLVIIAASMLLFRKGSLIIATICSLQYGILIDLEYYGIITPFITTAKLSVSVDWNHIIYRIVIVMVACFAVALLSGFLAMQAKIAKRDLKLMEDHLKRVERMATMGELAAGMAHEIKNPLASLSGSIQMLKSEAEPGTPNYRLMQIVLRETERLTRIVTDFLLFAKPSTMNAKEVNLAFEINQTIKLFRQDALCNNKNPSSEDLNLCSKEIEFETNLDESIYFNIDPDHFRQILWNLLKNAAESIHIKIANINESRDSSIDGFEIERFDGWIGINLFKTKDNRILLKVSDNGCGIEDGDVDSIFNPFFTKKSYGTGLGLSIIHRLVDLYNGLIDVESKVGTGTTFTVIFQAAS